MNNSKKVHYIIINLNFFYDKIITTIAKTVVKRINIYVYIYSMCI